jgi:hypothetical protein
LGEGLTEENYGWIFVDKIPLLYDKKRVARQHQIEKWLDLYQLTRELNIEKTERQTAQPATTPIKYVI